MSQVFYYLILKPLSYLPLGVLYIFSDLLFLLLTYVVPYRRKVVVDNLSRSFPGKTQTEINTITRKFYRHLADMMIESIKNFSISKKSLQKRLIILNPELPEQFLKNGRNVLFVGGHYNNWELYALALPLSTGFGAFAAFTPLTNRFLNKKTKESRSKFGLKMVTPREFKEILTQQDKAPFQIVFAADQSPSGNQKCHWMKFLNRDTAVLTGVERLAKDQNMVVIYGTIHKEKRGYYIVKYDLVTDNPGNTAEGEITEMHSRMLEKAILMQPEYWLWSHKRWKKTR